MQVELSTSGPLVSRQLAAQVSGVHASTTWHLQALFRHCDALKAGPNFFLQEASHLAVSQKENLSVLCAVVNDVEGLAVLVRAEDLTVEKLVGNRSVVGV